MDPNEALKQLRALVIQERNTCDLTELADLAGEMSELFDGLDNWLSNSGFLPADWNKRR